MTEDKTANVAGSTAPLAEDVAQHDTKTIGGAAPVVAATQATSGMGYMPGDGSTEAKLAVTGIEAEERYGVEGKPIPADECWVAPVDNFSKKDVRAEKWKLINYRKRTITFANTYDGMVGANFKQDVATFPLDPKKARKQTAGHTKVDVSQCPVAISLADAEAAGIIQPDGKSEVADHQAVEAKA